MNRVYRNDARINCLFLILLFQMNVFEWVGQPFIWPKQNDDIFFRYIYWSGFSHDFIVVILFSVFFFSFLLCSVALSICFILFIYLFFLMVGLNVCVEWNVPGQKSRPPIIICAQHFFCPYFFLCCFEKNFQFRAQSIFEHYGRCHMIATCEIKFYYLLLLFLLFVRHFTPQKRMSNVCICCFWI